MSNANTKRNLYKILPFNMSLALKLTTRRSAYASCRCELIRVCAFVIFCYFTQEKLFSLASICSNDEIDSSVDEFVDDTPQAEDQALPGKIPTFQNRIFCRFVCEVNKLIW